MNGFDEAFARFFASLQQSAGGFWSPFFYAITLMGNYGVFFIAVSLVLLIFKKTRKSGAVALFAIILGFLIGNLHFEECGRPPEALHRYHDGLSRLVAGRGISFRIQLFVPVGPHDDRRRLWRFLVPLLSQKVELVVPFASVIDGCVSHLFRGSLRKRCLRWDPCWGPCRGCGVLPCSLDDSFSAHQKNAA
jgi:hypothetical protein